MKERVFRISQELRPYIRLALARQKVPSHIFTKDGKNYIRIRMSGEKFHKVVLRARCEKLTHDTGLLHVTEEESDNPLFMETVLPGGGCFIVIGKKYD